MKKIVVCLENGLTEKMVQNLLHSHRRIEGLQKEIEKKQTETKKEPSDWSWPLSMYVKVLVENAYMCDAHYTTLCSLVGPPSPLQLKEYRFCLHVFVCEFFTATYFTELSSPRGNTREARPVRKALLSTDAWPCRPLLHAWEKQLLHVYSVGIHVVSGDQRIQQWPWTEIHINTSERKWQVGPPWLAYVRSEPSTSIQSAHQCQILLWLRSTLSDLIMAKRW